MSIPDERAALAPSDASYREGRIAGIEEAAIRIERYWPLNKLIKQAAQAIRHLKTEAPKK